MPSSLFLMNGVRFVYLYPFWVFGDQVRQVLFLLIRYLFIWLKHLPNQYTKDTFVDQTIFLILLEVTMEYRVIFTWCLTYRSNLFCISYCHLSYGNFCKSHQSFCLLFFRDDQVISKITLLYCIMISILVLLNKP